MMNATAWSFVTIVMFCGGLMIGGALRDLQWREKATSGFRMASGHALYEVRMVFNFKEPGP